MATFAVPCLFGLEGLVGDEIRRLGLPDVRVENGRVLCGGELSDIPKLNVNLRCGERVLVVAARFTARTFEELFDCVKAAPWEDYIPRDGQFPVKGHSLGSQLHSVPACQSMVKKAVATRLGEKYGLQTLPETGEKYQIQFAIMQDEVTVYLDTSGPGLHKRGYRAVGVQAPLRETLAAAMVTLSRYRGRDPFCDPFCGSGTIVIEAALIARNRAPGLDRSFDAQKWKIVPPSAWLEAGDEAMDKEFHGAYDIWGGDIDPRSVAIAADNARKAGVDDVVRFEVADVGKFRRTEEYGQLVTNPPYGERMLDLQEAEALYRTFGQAYRTLSPKWRVLALTSDPAFEKCFGRKADKKRKLYNGMLKCDLYMFQRG